jgi:hypothetical protein
MSFTAGGLATYQPYNLLDPSDSQFATPTTANTIGDWVRVNSDNPKMMIGAFGDFGTSPCDVAFEGCVVPNPTDGVASSDPTVIPILDPTGTPMSLSANGMYEANMAGYVWVRANVTNVDTDTEVFAFYG